MGVEGSPIVVPAVSVPARGPYSIALEAHGQVYLSGQGGLDPATGIKVPGGIRAETRRTLDTIDQLLREQGLTRASLVSITCYLADIDDWPAMNEVFVEFFDGVLPPTRTAVEVSRLPFDLAVELTAVAVR